MQGTRVPALLREDPPCREAAKTTCHSHWACAPGPGSHNLRPRATAGGPEFVLCNRRSHCNEGPPDMREERLLATARESPCAAPKTQHSQKLKKKNKTWVETQKTLNSQSNSEKEKQSWRNQAPWLQAKLQSYSHQKSMILATKAEM